MREAHVDLKHFLKSCFLFISLGKIHLKMHQAIINSKGLSTTFQKKSHSVCRTLFFCINSLCVNQSFIHIRFADINCPLVLVIEDLSLVGQCSKRAGNSNI